MPGRERTPGANPRPGPDPGYAEDKPRNRRDAHQPAEPSKPSPDEPGMRRDPDPDADPAEDQTAARK